MKFDKKIKMSKIILLILYKNITKYFPSRRLFLPHILQRLIPKFVTPTADRFLM